jgi:hypothetical protein
MNLRREGLRFISSLISWIRRYGESLLDDPKKHPPFPLKTSFDFYFSVSNQTQFDSMMGRVEATFLFSNAPQASQVEPFPSRINYSNLIKCSVERENGQR